MIETISLDKTDFDENWFWGPVLESSCADCQNCGGAEFHDTFSSMNPLHSTVHKEVSLRLRSLSCR